MQCPERMEGSQMGSPKVGSRLGTQFGPYELQSLIGVGGMGEVYRAYDTVRERMVAIKVLRTDLAGDASFQQRFRRESRVAARLQEPHVIPVHDFGDIDGVLYIDMRLVEGASLKDELRVNGALPLARTVSIICQVAAALDAAHASGLVHRDIKPENVLLTPDDFAYLVDFGIAHGGGEASVTSTGLVIGSAAYMATERLSGGSGGPASDVYSLTCLLYECLTGRPPFEAGDVRQVMSAHLFAPPPRPSLIGPAISPAFDEVIARGMAKKPADRYLSAGELGRAASAAASVGPAPVASPVRPGTRKFSAVDPNPAASGYVAYAPFPVPAAPPGKSRFGRAQVGLAVGTIVFFAMAAALAVVVVFSGDHTGASQPQTALAAPSSTEAPAPSMTAQSTSVPSATTSTTTVTTTAPSPSGVALSGMSGTDGQGFVGHSARCDAGSTPAAAIRTANSLAIVCQTSPGSYYYRGERLSDGADLQLANAYPSGGGFDVTNPADGAQYQVRPSMLTIISNGHVDSAEPALEYGSH
jgi:serine/threonine protein kinase